MSSRSIKTRITITVCIFVIIMQTLLAGVNLLLFKREFQNSISAQQFALLVAVGQGVDHKLEHALSILKNVAKEVPPDIFSDVEAAQQFLNNRPGTRITFDNVLFLLTPDGKLLAEAPYLPGRRGKDLSHRDYFRQTIADGKPRVSEPFYSTHSPGSPTVVMTVPLFDSQGRITGILCGGINLLGKNILGDLAGIRIGNSGYIYMLTSAGITIMHPDKSRIMTPHRKGQNILLEKALAGFEGTAENVNSRGVKNLTSFKRLSSTNWILGANYPLREAYQPLYREQLYYLLTIVLGGLFSASIAYWMTRRMTGTITRLAKHATDIDTKVGEERLFPVETSDEIGVLAQMLNAMVINEDKAKTELHFVNTHDVLTGLYNRTFFESRLNELSERLRNEVLLAVIDLDGLKKCNDTYGHAEGDRLIREAADLLRETFRSEDIIARIGGDEFAVILNGITEEGMKGMISRIEENLARKNGESTRHPLAMSIGFAKADHAEDIRTALALADRRMYHNKQLRKLSSE